MNTGSAQPTVDADYTFRYRVEDVNNLSVFKEKLLVIKAYYCPMTITSPTADTFTYLLIKGPNPNERIEFSEINGSCGATMKLKYKGSLFSNNLPIGFSGTWSGATMKRLTVDLNDPLTAGEYDFVLEMV